MLQNQKSNQIKANYRVHKRNLPSCRTYSRAQKPLYDPIERMDLNYPNYEQYVQDRSQSSLL